MEENEPILTRIETLRGYIGDAKRYDLYGQNDSAGEWLDMAAEAVEVADPETVEICLANIRSMIARRFNLGDAENEGMALCREAIALLPDDEDEGAGDADPLGSPASLSRLKIGELRELSAANGFESEGMTKAELVAALTAEAAEADDDEPEDSDLTESYNDDDGEDDE